MIDLVLEDYYMGDAYFLEDMYQKKEIQLHPGFTVLVGCNGCGKSTMMRQIEAYCKKNEIPCYYKNFEQNDHSLKESYAFHGNIDSLAEVLTSSEGEILRQGIGKCVRNIGAFIARNINTDKDKVVILLDAADSGSSIDNIVDLKEGFKDYIIKDIESHNIEPYIIISTNCYEMAYQEDCFLVNKGEYHMFQDYEEYRHYILQTADWKHERYEKREEE